MAGAFEQESDDRPVVTDGQRPSLAVVEAVADRKGVDPVEVGPLAYEIDPDALDSLVDSMDSGTITFPFEGLEVEVDADGEVSIDAARMAVAEADSVAD
ncbi:MAG: HalOD1 output domain-containing protein [Halanaeroarchaeum sp.]